MANKNFFLVNYAFIIGMTFGCNVFAASISGTIYHSDGTTPIINDDRITIDIYNHNNPDNSIATTTINSADGKYSITGLPRGSFDFRATADSYIDEFWANPLSVYYRYQSQPVTLTENEDLKNINFQLDPGLPVSGRVLQANEITPLQNIGICAFHESGCEKMWDFCTLSAIDGTYTVRLPVGNFYLDAGGGSSYILEWWAEPSSVRDCADASQVIIAESTPPISNKNFQLEKGVTISGTVFSKDGVSPIIGDTTISISVVRNNPCQSQGATYSMPINDNDGTYELLVEPGTYYLGTSANNYIDEWWHAESSVYSCSEAQILNVQADSPMLNHNFQLEIGSIISGTVFTSDNHTPLTGKECLWVNIITENSCKYNDQPTYASPVDPADATYTVHVPEGIYFMMANTCDWYSSEWWATPLSVSTSECEKAKALSVIPEKTYPNINFQIKANSHSPWSMFQAAIISGAKDCNGIHGGNAYIDSCNRCVGGNTGLAACTQDCNGVFGGTAVKDECGICGGDGPPCPPSSLGLDCTDLLYNTSDPTNPGCPNLLCSARRDPPKCINSNLEYPCLGSSRDGGKGYCSNTCQTDADCTNLNIPMKCLSNCSYEPQNEVVGKCYSLTTYNALINEICGGAIGPTMPCSSLNQNGPETILKDGREWQRCDILGLGEWDYAKYYCENLDLNNHTDWRLPTKDELKALIQCTNGTAAPEADQDTCCEGMMDPSCDPNVPQIESDFYCRSAYLFWTSTTTDTAINEWGFPVDVWGVNFSEGKVQMLNKTNNAYTRCIR